MTQTTINSALNLISHSNIPTIATKLSYVTGDDLDFEESDYSASIEYLKSYCSSEIFLNQSSKLHFYQCIGRIVASEKWRDASGMVANMMREITKQEIFLDIDDDLYAQFMYPAHDEFCELLMSLNQRK